MLCAVSVKRALYMGRMHTPCVISPGDFLLCGCFLHVKRTGMISLLLLVLFCTSNVETQHSLISDVAIAIETVPRHANAHASVRIDPLAIFIGHVGRQLFEWRVRVAIVQVDSTGPRLLLPLKDGTTELDLYNAVVQMQLSMGTPLDDPVTPVRSVAFTEGNRVGVPNVVVFITIGTQIPQWHEANWARLSDIAVAASNDYVSFGFYSSLTQRLEVGSNYPPDQFNQAHRHQIAMIVEVSPMCEMETTWPCYDSVWSASTQPKPGPKASTEPAVKPGQTRALVASSSGYVPLWLLIVIIVLIGLALIITGVMIAYFVVVKRRRHHHHHHLQGKQGGPAGASKSASCSACDTMTTFSATTKLGGTEKSKIRPPSRQRGSRKPVQDKSKDKKGQKGGDMVFSARVSVD